MVAILSDQRDVIFEAVRAMYTAVARKADTTFHFPHGRAACELVGYPMDLVDTLPESAVESFAGVGYVFAANVIEPGEVVLDVGSGSGTDLLIARRLVGPAGTVIGLDLTDAMLEKLEHVVSAAAVSNVRLLNGNAEDIPLPDGSVDVVTSNGVLNLVPDKRQAIGEIHRVLRPGGRVQIADIALGRPLGAECRADPQLWAECVVGALLEDEYLELFRTAGFEHFTVLGHLDYFAASPSPATRNIASSFGARSLVLRAGTASAVLLRDPLPWPRAAQSGIAVAPTRERGEAGLPRADATLDAHGQTCGSLEPLLKTRMGQLEAGQVIEVACDDPASRFGIPSWSRLTGHPLLAVIETDETHTRFYLKKT